MDTHRASLAMVMRATTSRQDVLRLRTGHEARNIEAAALILVDADRYGGDSSLAVLWARRVLARQPNRVDGGRGQRELFGEAAA
jgi:hypothetical protein